MGNHGFAVERFDVFAGDAFAAAAGGDDAEGHGWSLLVGMSVVSGVFRLPKWGRALW